MRVVTRISPLSAFKVVGLLYACMGVVVGALVSLISLAGLLALPQEGGALFGMFFGAFAIVFLPIFYGVLGALVGAVGALLYNLIARWVGGLEVEVA